MELVRRGFDAFAKGGPDAMVDFWDPEITLRLQSSLIESGTQILFLTSSILTLAMLTLAMPTLAMLTSGREAKCCANHTSLPCFSVLKMS